MGVFVEAVGLTRRFGALTAVDRLDLEVREGEIFALVGPDGAGKTTTLRLLTGLLDPSEGRAVVAGHDVARHPDTVRDQIGYMAQRFGLYGDLTVDENMAFYADLFGVVGEEREELAARLLHMARLEPFRRRPAAKLSGGMRQKLALACTLLHKPRVLLLDEPTNGVDPVSRRDFWEILRRLARDGLSVLLTTAYLDEAERADRVGLMHRGRLIRCDPPAALRAGVREGCYRLKAADLRRTRQLLMHQPGVLAVQSSGTDLHLFLEATAAPEDLAAVTPFEWERIQPTLEDVFIEVVRRGEAASAGGPY
jgi:ABC-2 type transport system ATP-binding protein